jgi:tetratricopeptide (TPR) repeat protein
MSFFKKLFGIGCEPAPVKVDDPTPPPQPPAQTIEELRNDPNLIQVYDKYGQEIFISKEEWRKSVLPGAIKDNWSSPDGLYSTILGALNDGFRTDIIGAAEQLYKIDSNDERGACVWGIVLMEEGHLDRAEKVFRDFNAKHGESGVILTNLAKVFSKRDNKAKAEETLWHALEVDPNQDNGFVWYEAVCRERGGESAGIEAMQRVAAVPNSWRAQLWLAREALKTKDIQKALVFYEESLTRVGTSIPGDLLMQIGGDLGNAGYLKEIIQLVEPRFNVDMHGLIVGNNLIKAHIELGETDAARRILDQLYAKKRPDWKATLNYWDTELAKIHVASTPVVQKDQFKVGMLNLEGPIWLKPTSPAMKFFFEKPANSIRVCFLGSTAEMESQDAVLQLADGPGRLSRSIPLFLAEQVEMGTRATTQTLAPWATEPSGAFIVSGGRWSDEKAVEYAQNGEVKCAYVVITHLITNKQSWTVDMRLVRTSDGTCLRDFSESFDSDRLSDTPLRLAQNLLDWLKHDTEIKSQTVPAAYALPATQHLAYYLLRLEQLLAVRCSCMDGVPAGFLSGERAIIEGNIQQCEQTPYSVSVRLLLAQTLLVMKHVRPDIMPEFREQVKLLQDEHPLIDVAQNVVQTIIDEAMATTC